MVTTLILSTDYHGDKKIYKGMKYELARELRDKGFPQKGSMICPNQGNEAVFGIAYVGSFRLHCGFTPFKVHTWDVSIVQAIDNVDRALVDFEVKDCPTPEEAVARLWLVIHKNETNRTA